MAHLSGTGKAEIQAFDEINLSATEIAKRVKR